MLDRLKSWLLGAEQSGATRGDPGATQRRAAAVLLVEAARLDGEYSADERARIRSLLAHRFGLAPADAETLVAAGEMAQDEAVELSRFARAVTASMSEAEREGLIEMLWEVVYADGQLHDFEANMMRRMAGLLHVSDRASALARQKVQSRLAGGR